jgi:toxin FitB
MYSTSYLTDTNVLSELGRRRPDPGVAAWAREVTGILVSAVSIEELRFGLTWHPNPRVQEEMERVLRTRCTVLPVTEAIARAAGQMRGQFQAIGQTRTQPDMLIAATAQVHQLTLVTRNTRDFEGCLIGLLNPFSSI